VSLIYPDNAASINVARKVGMRWDKEVELEGNMLGLYRLDPRTDRATPTA
jgi:RimJ/RimL family protein N-acetyltransferase